MGRQLFPSASPARGACTLNTSSPQAVGLLGWWPTTEGAGGIIRNRASSLYDMTLAGTYTRPVPDAVVGNAVAYNGSSGYASTTTLNPASFTVSAWVRYAAFSSNNCPVGLFGSGSDKGWWLNFASSGELYLWISTDGSAQAAISSGTTVASTNTWYHIAATYNGGACAIYINGVSVATGTIGTSYHVVTTANALAIARLGALSADYSNAAIADVRLYNRAMSAAEVWQLYAPQTRWDLYRPLNVLPYYVAPPATPPHGTNNATRTLYAEPRRTTPRYEVYLTDITTRRIALVRRFESLTYSRVLNGVGEFELTLRSDFDTGLIREGGLVEVHRAHDGEMSPRLDFVGFILGQPEYFVEGNNYFVKVKGPDLNHMLTWREQVGYVAAAEMTGYVDDNMRYFTDVNLGVGAAAGRSLYADYGFTVEPNRSWAASMTVKVDRRPVADYLSGMAKQSTANATKPVRLFYGVVPTGVNPLRVQFQVRAGLWGVDRTATGSAPVVLRPGRGLRNVVIERDATDEKTVVYPEYNTGAIGTPVTADGRLYTSSAGRREGYLNVNDTTDATTADNMARTELRDKRRVYRVRGEVEQVRGAAYGDYGLGDHLTLATRGVLTTIRVDGVSVTVANGGDAVAVKYEYVE